MNTKWNLTNIYESVNCNKFKNDVENYKTKIDTLNSWCKSELSNTDNVVEKLEYYIELKNDIMQYERLIMYVNLALSTDTTNSALLKANDMLEDIESKMSYHETLFIQFLKKIDNINTIINSSNILKEHSYYINEQAQLATHTLSPEEESIISKMKSTGSSACKKMWEQLSSTLMIDYKGEELSLSEIRNLAYSNDKNTRKSAYEAELSNYEKIELPASMCLNSIKGEVITIANLRNYNSPLDMTLQESRIDENILNAMFNSIKKSLPQLRKYFYKKAEHLGYKKSLPFYELFAPIGNTDLNYSLEEARDFVIDCFYKFSKDLGDFAKFAFDNQWIDLLPAKGKVGGAFCESIHSIKESRILTNFGGTFNDVVTIAHELGHAFHNTRLFDNTQLNSFYPMPIAETASTFCETIIVNEALKIANKEEQLVILENDLQSLTQCVIDIYSRFLFEDMLFNKRKDGSLSVEEMQQTMLQAQKEAYGDGLDANYLHKDMWVCKPHYYDADFNYYNFPYAFGALLSKGLYAIYMEMGDDFIPLYDKFLAESSKNNLADVAKIVGIDLYAEDFWLKGLNMIINEIDEM